jgi:ankyrin repeat protein
MENSNKKKAFYILVHLVCRGLLSEHDARRISPLNKIIIEKLEQRLEIVKYLYSHGASIDTFDHDGLTPFMYACSSGNYSLVKYLLDEQINKDETSTLRIINERSNTGETCLMYAIESGNLDIVTILCNHQAKLDDQTSPSYVTAAAFYGHRDILEKLIQLGLNVNEYGKVKKKTNDSLLTNKKNLLDQNDDGVIFNPVYACCHSGSVECLQLLLEAKAKIDWRTNQGN